MFGPSGDLDGSVCIDTESTTGESSSTYSETFLPRFADIPQVQKFPNTENDYMRAKAYLMQQNLDNGDSLWDHMNELLKKILCEKPKGIADTFEEFSLKLRQSRSTNQADYMHDVYIPPPQYASAQKLLPLLSDTAEKSAPQPKEFGEEELDTLQTNMQESLHMFAQAGIGLPGHDMFWLGLQMKELTTQFPIDKYRFWGKIFGLKKNYYLVEADLTEDEIEKRRMAKAEEEESQAAAEGDRERTAEEEDKTKRELYIQEAKQRELDFAQERTHAMASQATDAGGQPPPASSPWPFIPPLPTPLYKPPPQCPAEPSGMGVNKKSYYACSAPGEEWVELPDVTPQQIVAARKVKRAFTGNLTSKVSTYPTFPGTEVNYLRAQIARISAGTQISPLGFYTFNEEEIPEEEDEDLGRADYMENPDYECVNMADLTDASMAFWVHHTQYILEQGRTTWWHPTAAPNEEELGEEEEEPEDEVQVTDREMGPNLLTPLSEDATMEGVMPWSVRNTSPKLYPESALAVVRSNLWPGAYAVANSMRFENVYVGDGLKFWAYNLNPMPVGDVQEEYALGPEIMEVDDPTPEDEEAWRVAHEKKPIVAENDVEDEIAEEEEEDEEDDE